MEGVREMLVGQPRLPVFGVATSIEDAPRAARPRHICEKVRALAGMGVPVVESCHCAVPGHPGSGDDHPRGNDLSGPVAIVTEPPRSP